MVVLVLVLMVVLATGCAGMERDTSIYYVWAKRGQQTGDLAHLYCNQGGPRERAIFRHALESQAGRAQVTITCSEKE